MIFDENELNAQSHQNNVNDELSALIPNSTNASDLSYLCGNARFSNVNVNLLSGNTELTALTLDQLNEYKKNNKKYKLYYIIAAIITIILETIFINIFNIDVLCWLFHITIIFAFGFPAIFIFAYQHQKGEKAQECFKHNMLGECLKHYISNLSLQEKAQSENYPLDAIEIDDLTQEMDHAKVISSLHLGFVPREYVQMKTIYEKEWITGLYKDIHFIFYEVEIHTFMNEKNIKITNGSGEYGGQGYIFSIPISIPFPIQYDFNNVKECELTVENFSLIFSCGQYKEDVFNPYKAHGVALPKGNLSVDENDIIEILETPEFKTFLLNLAKVFDENDNSESSKYGEKIISGNWSVRLQNQNLIILRKGKSNYFEFELSDDICTKLKQIENEISDFLTVLDMSTSLNF